MKRNLYLLVALLSLIIPVATQAAPDPAKQSGITVSPGFQEVIVRGADKRKPVNFTVTNNDSSAMTFDLSAIDMGTLNETGGLIFSGLQADYQKKYGLASWVELSQTSVTIKGKSTSTINLYIRSDDTLTPGGHYGAIVLKPRLNSGAGKNQVAFSPQSASLLFLKKIGGEVYKMRLTGTETQGNLWGLPSQIKLGFKNEGNVHVVPRGLAVIKDPWGREVRRGIINEASSLILPERSRILLVSLAKQKTAIWPGRYSVIVNFRYDGQEEMQQTVVYFTWLNPPLVLTLLATMVLAGYGAYRFVPVLIRERSKKVAQASNKKSQTVRIKVN